jgi:hypothetical protein
MSSRATGVELNLDDAMLLLQRLSTPSMKVQASLFGPFALRAFVTGAVELSADGRVSVRTGPRLLDSFIEFEPHEAVSRKWADKRAFPVPLLGPLLDSILWFGFPDGVEVALLVESDPEE